MKIPRCRKIAPLALLLLLLTPTFTAHGQNGSSPTPDAQRVELLDRIGGLIGASLPLPDGTALVAEGSTLARIRLDSESAVVLARADLRHGALLDLAGEPPRFYALAEEGVIALESGEDDLPRAVDFAPGGGQTFAVRDDLVAVAAREAGLRLLRVGAEGRLHPQATLALPGGALDVALSPDGGRAYVAGGEAGVYVVDLADPAVPQLAGVFSDPAPAQTVALAGALLAVGSGGQVTILDPSSNSGDRVGLYAPLRAGRRVAIQDDYAYVADAAGGLKIIWLAAPDRPVQVYGEAGNPAYDVLLDGETAYVAGDGGLRILDVSNRYHPLELARLELPGLPQGIALGMGRIYVALGDEGVAVVGLENPVSPRLDKRIPLDGPAHALLYDRGMVYVAAGEAGLATVEAGQPGGETLLATLQLPGPILDIERYGGALYLAAGEAGLLAMDITRPDTPVLAGVLAPREGRSYESVAISGKRAHVAYGEGFIVADVNRPTDMGRLARVRVAARHVGQNGVYLYALGEDRITAYDARATAEPIYLRTYLAPRQIAATAAEGDRLFLAHAGDGPDLVVLGLQAPDYPVELDNVGADGNTLQARPNSGEVWLARGYGGLRRYTLTEGGALILQGAYSTLVEVTRLALGGDRLLAGGRAGWSALALGEDAHPRPAGRAGEMLSVRGLAVDGNTAAVAAGEDGIALYSLDGVGVPALIEQRETTGPAVGVAFAGDVIVAADSGGLAMFDRRYLASVRRVSTPAAPTGLAIRESLAYLTLADGTLAVIDLGEPTGGIRVLSSISTRRPTDLILAPDGRTVYGLADETVSLLRTSDPGALAVAAQGFLPDPATQGFFVGNLLAAFTPGRDARLYDLAALEESAIPRGKLDIATETLAGEAVAVKETVAYVAYGEAGLGLVDIRTPGTGRLIADGEVHALYLDGDTLFTAGDAITAWDVTRPEAPEVLASLELFAPASHIDPAPDGRLLVSLENGLAVVAWDGEALTTLGDLATPGAVRQAVQVGTRGYLALRRDGLHVVDLSDPVAPVGLFSYTSPSGQIVSDLLPLDEAHLLVSWEDGIDVLEVGATDAAPRLVSVTPASGSEARGVTLSPDGSRAAVALGDDGVALISLADPRAPQVVGRVETHGDGLAAALDGATLFVADGLCGLRVFDVADPAAPRETGYWRGSFAADVAVGGGVVYLADGNRLLTLHHDPALPGVPPPAPRLPDPPNGADGVPLTLTLKWGPPADPCDPLSYAIYFGVADDPPLVGEVMGVPELEIGELAPLRTYHWRVEATDRQGDSVRGPVWRFTTASAEFADTIPPAPPPFVEQFRQHPVGALVFFGGMVALLGWAIYRRYRRRSRTQPAVPDWYSTEADEE